MVAGLRVALLGPLSVTVAGEEVGPAGALRRSLLVMLALRPGEVVPVDAIVDGLWGERPPRTAIGVLQTYVSTWRKALDAVGAGPRIATTGAGYRLDLADGESDLLDFARLAADGQRLAEEGRASDARTALERALALWRGPALADLADRPFHAAGVRPVEERRQGVVEDWAQLVLRTGTDDDLAVVAGRLEQLRAAHPWRERTTELLMWTLFRQSRQRDALALFEETRRRLDDELGIDPGPALRAMHERVLRQDRVLDPTSTPPKRERRPPRLDSFIGRDREVGDVSSLLETCRLVTLTGPGGSGKTRLAEEVAAVMATGDVETAVVELAPVEDLAHLPGAIATGLGIGPAETVPALAAQLVDRRLLLVLDNLEQLADAGPAVADLLRRTTALRILATSREPLRVAGEHVFPVDPLPVPAADEMDATRLGTTPSIVLLVDRARSQGARITEGDEAALRDVVRALDGLPLALEIVAPWLGVVGASGLLGELDRRLDLTTRLVGADERHRTLRSAIAWSHDRLTPPEQRLLRRMAVLRGSGDLDAVRAVAGEDLGGPVLDVLAGLLERNLVQRAEPVAGTPRYRLLETVRQFAAEHLDAAGERASTKLRAAEHFATWAVGLAAHSEGPDADRWIASALAESDNLRASVATLEGAGRTAESLQLVADMEALWFEAGLEGEGERRLRHALETAPAEAPARPAALTFLSWFVAAHDRDGARQHVHEAISRARSQGDDAILAMALESLGGIAADPRTALSASAAAVALADRVRGREVRYAASAADVVASAAASHMSDQLRYRALTDALTWTRTALAMAERSGDQRATAAQLAELSYLHLLAGDPDAATAPLDRARELTRGLRTGRSGDVIELVGGLWLHATGQPDTAAAAFRELVDASMAAGRHTTAHHGFPCLIDALADTGSVAEADVVLRRAESLSPERPDLRHDTRLRVRRVRLLRLTGRVDDAVVVLDRTEEGIDPGALSPECVLWLVEHALLADDAHEARAWVDRLEDLSRQTGVAIPPWERQLLVAAHLMPARRG